MTEAQRIESVSNNPEKLNLIKEENRTYPICLAAVRSNGSALLYVPKELRTEELLLAACESNGTALRWIPDAMKTKEMCELAVNSDGEMLSYVPEAWRTQGLCEIAVSHSSAAISEVPGEYITPEFCARFITERNQEYFLKNLPAYYKNTPFLEKLVALKPCVFKVLPKKNRTAKVSRLALKGLGYSSAAEAVEKDVEMFNLLNPSLLDSDACLAYVKNEPKFGELVLRDHLGLPLDKLLISEEICREALSRHRFSLDKVPGKFISESVCLAAVKQWGYNLSFVPDDLKSEEICEAAVKNSGESLQYVPEHLKTADLCEAAVAQSGYALQYVPIEYRTSEMCLKSVKDNGSFIKYVPYAMRTEELCRIAISNDRNVIRFIPKEILSKDMVLTACEKAWNLDTDVAQYIPEEMWDYDLFCVFAKKGRGHALRSAIRYVPRTRLTQEMCIAEVKLSPSAAVDVPKEFQTEEIYIEMARGLGKLGEYRPSEIVRKIPDEFKTAELFEEIKNNVSATCYTRICESAGNKPIFNMSDDGFLWSMQSFNNKEIVFPEGIKSLGIGIDFTGIDAERLIFPEGFVTANGGFSRHVKRSVKYIRLPASFKPDFLSPFGNFNALECIDISDDHPDYSTVNGVVYSKDKTELVFCPANHPDEKFVVPDSVTKISNEAFKNCCNLKEIVLPNHYVELGSYVFSYCKNLKQFAFPEGIKIIPAGILEYTDITSIDIPDSVEEIGDKAFGNAKLTSLVLPKGLKRIGSDILGNTSGVTVFIPKETKCLFNRYSFSEDIGNVCKEFEHSITDGAIYWVKYEIDVAEGAFLWFENDGLSPAKFNEEKVKATEKLADEDYLRLIREKKIRKKHFAYAAFLRLFVDSSGLNPETRKAYTKIVKECSQTLLQLFARENKPEYAQQLRGDGLQLR